MYRSGFIVLFSIQYADVFLELFCPLVTTHTHNKHLNEAVELDLFPLLLDLFMPRVFEMLTHSIIYTSQLDISRLRLIKSSV